MNQSKVKREKMAYKKKRRNRFIGVMKKILQLDARVVRDGKTGHCNNKRCYYSYKSKLQWRKRTFKKLSNHSKERLTKKTTGSYVIFFINRYLAIAITENILS